LVLCVFIPRRKERVNYICAANSTTVHTYGWLPLSLNLELRRDFTWRFAVADVTHPLVGVDCSHFGLLADASGPESGGLPSGSRRPLWESVLGD
jgi:hypothetical protein